MQLTFWGDWLFGGGAEFPYVVEVSVPPVVVSIKGGARGGGTVGSVQGWPVQGLGQGWASGKIGYGG